ncbi:MAG TPA: peptidylprolyl isomerase [Pirellulales bacterium]|nr:peptidylprolyl isomerase [Pirellulales bacterium]
MGILGFRKARVRKLRALFAPGSAGIAFRALRCEPLEDRRLLTVTFNQITGPETNSGYNIPSGKDLYVPLTASDPGQAITYTATTTNSSVTATVLTGNPELVLNVAGTDAQGHAFSGTLTFVLFQNLAPQTVQGIINDVNNGIFDTASFYRMETDPSFSLIQGGLLPPSNTNPTVTGPTLPNEYNVNVAFNSPGVLAMAASTNPLTGQKTASTEIFVMAPGVPLAQEPQFLNYGYTIFGQLLNDPSGVYSKIQHVPTTAQGQDLDYANTPVVITSATIINNDNQNAVLQIAEPAGFTGNATVTVTATGSDSSSKQQSFNVSVLPVSSGDSYLSLNPISNLTTQAGQSVQFTISATEAATLGSPTFSIGDQNPFGQAPYPAPQNVTVTVTPGANNTATVTLTPKAGFSGTLNLVAHADDRNSGLSDAQAFTLTVTGSMNVQVPGSQQVTANQSLAIPGVSITDAGLPAFANVTTTFSVAHGTITLPTNVAAGITAAQITGNGTSSVTITAPLAATNATLAATNGLVYAPTIGFAGADNLAIASSDSLGNTATASISLSVVTNFLISVPTSPLATPMNTSLAVSGLSLSDPSLPSGDTVTLSLSALHGTILLKTSVSGGVSAAQVTGNGTANVVVTATLAQINATLAAPAGIATVGGVTYSPAPGYSGADTVNLGATDQLGNSASNAFSIAIGALINAPSTIEAPSGIGIGVTGISLVDPSVSSAGAVTLRIAVGHGVLNVATNISGGVTNVSGNNSGLVTLTGTLAQLNTTLAALNGLRYRSNTGFHGPDTLSLLLDDQLQSTIAATITISVVGPLSVNLPASAYVRANSSTTVTGASIVDPGLPSTDNVTVVLSAAEGTIALSTAVTGGVTAGQVTGNSTGSVTVTATLSQINATLAAASGLTYTPLIGVIAIDSLTLAATDSAGNSDTEQATFSILGDLSVELARNQLPVTPGLPTPITGVTVSEFGLSDSSNVTVTLSVLHGTLNVATDVISGLNPAEITGNGTNNVTITAPLYQINNTQAASNGLSYTPDAGFVGRDFAFIQATDPVGNTATASINLGTGIFVTAPPFLQVIANSSQPIAGISIQNTDEPNQFYDVTITAPHGILALSTTVPGGATSNEIFGNGSSFVMFQGALDEINATLSAANGLSYTPFSGYIGSDEIDVSAENAGGETGSASIAVSVSPPLSIVAPLSPVPVGGGVTPLGGISLVEAVASPSANVVTTFSVEHGRLTLSTSVAGGITAAQILGNGTNLVTVLAPLSAINATLADAHGLSYAPLSGAAGPDQLSITAEDSLQNVASAIVQLSLAGPISFNNVPTSPILVAPQGDQLLSLGISDPGFPTGNNVTVTLSASHGTITVPLSMYGGLSADQVSGNGTSMVVVTAPLDAINTTLEDLDFSYQPANGYVGPDTVTVAANDGVGNIGNVSIAIIDVGPLTITVPTAPAHAVGGQTVAISGVSLSDPGLPAPYDVRLDISVQQGQILMAANIPGGVTADEVAFLGSHDIAITATLAQINATLAAANGLSYQAPPGFSGSDSLSLIASDPANFVRIGQIAAQVTSPPEIKDVAVDSTGWSQNFEQQLTFLNPLYGYSLPSGAAQLSPLPWSGLNEIRVQFNEPVNVQQGSLTLTGLNVAQYTITGFSYDAANYSAVWTLSKPIGADRVQIHLASTGLNAVTDLSGNPLDGDWTDGARAYPSGNGQAGGDFNFSFNVLPGDVNRDGIVNVQDLALVSSSWLASLQNGAFNGFPWIDPNGDGIINAQDLATLSASWTKGLPAQPAGTSVTMEMAAGSTPALSSGASQPADATASVAAAAVPSSAPAAPQPAVAAVSNVLDDFADSSHDNTGSSAAPVASQSPAGSPVLGTVQDGSGGATMLAAASMTASGRAASSGQLSSTSLAAVIGSSTTLSPAQTDSVSSLPGALAHSPAAAALDGANPDSSTSNAAWRDAAWDAALVEYAATAENLAPALASELATLLAAHHRKPPTR